MTPLRTRFAPTPNGYLHLGNFYNLIWVVLHARARGAEIGLRIDDYDQTRYRTHFVDDIFAVLERAGFEWQHGPSTTKEFEREYSSRLRRTLYRAAETKLEASARTYWCLCTRKMEAGALVYSGRCREAGHAKDDVNDEGLAAQLRFRMNGISLKKEIGDFIVLPRGGELAYHVASVVDDMHFGYKLLVRGRDLRPSSEAQCELAPELGLASFATETTFVHHPLIVGPNGEKLSKSQSASPVLKHLRAPEGLRQVLRDFAQTQLYLPETAEIPDRLDEFAQLYAARIPKTP
ncbi:MAG TPA: glutamate--tRNA ligase family protein [Bdellovibrionota bacterium]|jgi:glutamyl-tRNA synthetase|nr:glutamate--tRNA ligase family protein [Bdellovibrionota bacterium]